MKIVRKGNHPHRLRFCDVHIGDWFRYNNDHSDHCSVFMKMYLADADDDNTIQFDERGNYVKKLQLKAEDIVVQLDYKFILLGDAQEPGWAE